MALTMRRVPVVWTTGVGGAGVSVFYSGDTDDLTTNLATFFNAVKGFFPSVVTWSIPAAGDKIIDETGHLAGAWAGGTAATIAGTGGVGTYIAGTGAYVRWITGAVVGTHKLQGRTFLAPLISGTFDAAGTLNDANVATMQAAATALAASNKLIIWHRPHPGGSDGTNRLVIAAVVPDKVTSLRTRRT
jgi:hypothetical protein